MTANHLQTIHSQQSQGPRCSAAAIGASSRLNTSVNTAGKKILLSAPALSSFHRLSQEPSFRGDAAIGQSLGRAKKNR